jgi:DNA-binding response OmpR family regulator
VKVLVVEDDARLREVLTRALRESGHVVDDAADGLDGLSYAVTGAYDAVVLDAMLPGRDGFSVVRDLRAAGIGTPILFLTARSAPEDAVAGLDAGADDYMRKPFDIDELEARLRSISRREAGNHQPALCVEDVVYDPAARRAERAGRLLGLTARESLFLEYLMRNAGQLLTRDMIVESLWGYDSRIESNVVDVYVRRLRAKLEANGEDRLLHTVRGLGYRFGRI